MRQISAQEFERLPLRGHEFMAGVPLHDAWVVDLPKARSGITLDEFLRTAPVPPLAPSPVVRGLLALRLFIGRIFGWDDTEKIEASEAAFAARMTDADRARSRVPPGTPDEPFRVVYRFENEQLVEIINRTAHAAALSALVETPDAYRYYFAIYVRNVSHLTPLYMAAIDPFRKFVVYPSLMRSVLRSWNKTFERS
ncbi:MAG: DUF2867 domain-containing protein [Candidatus Eremiobacteraeota bacterium]|nr:DUF2867 domain-containing protein [Candidatus Eremiobacteraeota bacterium]